VAVLKEGENCWRISHADRAAFLIDGAAYFESVADAIEQAQTSVCISAWDIDSRIRLMRRSDTDADPQSLGPFLNAKTKRTRGLQVYVLAWDFPMLYVREREWLPIFNLGWKTHQRIYFHLDDEHPIGASQHQKLMVIDNSLAFCGGLDLSNSRWDTPQHEVEDPRRKDPNNKPYNPVHDLQMAVSGDAAAALGELFGERWVMATGTPIDVQDSQSAEPWPKDLRPDLKSECGGGCRFQHSLR
jgi:phosphatidylserine/phosphatidylglycerophosphate/cardiolipin synthase-like enzyme